MVFEAGKSQGIMLDTRMFPPEYRGKYPHMFPLDIAVWERFLDKLGDQYLGFYYDITCGKPCTVGDALPDEYKRDAEILSRLRIDVVGEKERGTDLIEVKPKANMSAIGQLLTYKECYISDYVPEKPVSMILVCGQIDQNFEPALERAGITYIVV